MELSQRIAVSYLLFVVVGTVALGVGIFWSTQKFLSTRSENRGLAMVGQATPVVLISCLKHDAEHLQQTVQHLHAKHRLLYGCVTDNSGKYIAHTKQGQLGKRARSEIGKKKSWGDIQTVAFENEKQISILEYKAPLVSGKQNFGTLTMAVINPSIWDTLRSSQDYILIALLFPAAILGAGVIVIQRSIKPLCAIEKQLRYSNSVVNFDRSKFDSISMKGPVANGWNRLVEGLRLGTQSDQKILDAVNHYRQNQVFKILDSLPDGIVVTDSQNVIKLANAAFLNIFEIAEEKAEFVGKSIIEFIRSDGNQEDVEMSLASNSISELSRFSGDSERVLRIARHRMREQNDSECNQQIWTISDITQRKLTEKMRDEFLDSATHELRTPLSNIKAYAETLAISEVLDVEQQKEFCNTINSEATRLARFIDDLLSISNVEAGSLAISRENTEVDRLMREIVEKVRPSMVKKDLEFNIDLPQKTLPSLFIDKDKIQVALVNLMGNAAKYTPKGGRVDVTVKLLEDQIVFSVEDTGIGIAEDEIPKLFDKFFRSDDNLVQNETGTGLGLSLANEIIRLHGGKITVESQKGQGSKFTIFLPAKSEAFA